MWISLMGVNGERVDINLNHAAIMSRLGDQTTITMALAGSESPVTVQVRETPDQIYGLRKHL
jgi:hypothetical protein